MKVLPQTGFQDLVPLYILQPATHPVYQQIMLCDM